MGILYNHGYTGGNTWMISGHGGVLGPERYLYGVGNYIQLEVRQYNGVHVTCNHS